MKKYKQTKIAAIQKLQKGRMGGKFQVKYDKYVKLIQSYLIEF